MFLSTGSLGSHNIVAGYDNFTGKEVLNNYQSGSNYVVGSTAAIQKNGDLFPVFDSSSYIIYFPITQQSAGSDVRTHAVFLNDQWRLTDRVSFNLGVRWDKNAAKDAGGVTRADDSTFSPRLGATWDVTGQRQPARRRELREVRRRDPGDAGQLGDAGRHAPHPLLVLRRARARRRSTRTRTGRS